jgi:putative membrane protein
MTTFSLSKSFRWKILLLRVAVNALALAVVILLLPSIYLVDRSVLTLLILSVALGILNALVKPIMQFLTMPFIFASYGLVVVLVNTLVLYLLGHYFPNRFIVENFFWAVVGGLLIGIVGNFLENLFGLSLPILPDEQTELRRRVIEQDRGLLKTLLARSKSAKVSLLITGEEPAALQLDDPDAVVAPLPASAETPAATDPSTSQQSSEVDS